MPDPAIERVAWLLRLKGKFKACSISFVEIGLPPLPDHCAAKNEGSARGFFQPVNLLDSATGPDKPLPHGDNSELPRMRLLSTFVDVGIIRADCIRVVANDLLHNGGLIAAFFIKLVTVCRRGNENV